MNKINPDILIGNENLICLSEPAATKALKLIASSPEEPFLRIGISGGGCNGLSYKMKFVSKTKKGDILVKSNQIDVLVDSKSALYLKGTTLDYSDALVGGGFEFVNPNAASSCSCGESFNV